MAIVKDEIERLLEQYEPQMQKAFLDAIADINDSVVITRLIERLQAGDLEGAITVINMDPVVFNNATEVIRSAYRDAGLIATAGLPILRDSLGAKLILRFNVRIPPAEEWLRTESSTFVRGITRPTMQGIRASLSEGMAAGTNPRTVALDVVGRVNKQTGRRQGGIIGLTEPQVEFRNNARLELQSNDPALLRNYLIRARRDKRFDPTVKRAIATGKPIPAEKITEMVGKYSDNLLLYRGETIARTEMLISLHEGQAEAMRQVITSGAASPEDVTKIWKDVRDGRVRHSHTAMNGQTVAYDQPFVSPYTGSKLMYPGDRSLGAAASEIINCRCHAQYKVDYLSIAARKIRAKRNG